MRDLHDRYQEQRQENLPRQYRAMETTSRREYYRSSGTVEFTSQLENSNETPTH
jgi:hypothetical protein